MKLHKHRGRKTSTKGVITENTSAEISKFTVKIFDCTFQYNSKQLQL